MTRGGVFVCFREMMADDPVVAPSPVTVGNKGKTWRKMLSGTGSKLRRSFSSSAGSSHSGMENTRDAEQQQKTKKNKEDKMKKIKKNSKEKNQDEKDNSGDNTNNNTDTKNQKDAPAAAAANDRKGLAADSTAHHQSDSVTAHTLETYPGDDVEQWRDDDDDVAASAVKSKIAGRAGMQRYSSDEDGEIDDSHGGDGFGKIKARYAEDEEFVQHAAVDDSVLAQHSFPESFLPLPELPSGYGKDGESAATDSTMSIVRNIGKGVHSELGETVSQVSYFSSDGLIQAAIHEREKKLMVMEQRLQQLSEQVSMLTHASPGGDLLTQDDAAEKETREITGRLDILDGLVNSLMQVNVVAKTDEVRKMDALVKDIKQLSEANAVVTRSCKVLYQQLESALDRICVLEAHVMTENDGEDHLAVSNIRKIKSDVARIIQEAHGSESSKISNGHSIGDLMAWLQKNCGKLVGSKRFKSIVVPALCLLLLHRGNRSRKGSCEQ